MKVELLGIEILRKSVFLKLLFVYKLSDERIECTKSLMPSSRSWESCCLFLKFSLILVRLNQVIMRGCGEGRSRKAAKSQVLSN